MKNTHDNNPSDGPVSANDRRSFLRLAAGFGTATLGAGLLAACGGGDTDVTAGGREGAQTRTIGNCSSKAGQVVDAAGNTVGYIDFINDGTNVSLFVYSADNARCALRDMKLWLGTDLALLPVDGSGVPRFADLPWQHSAIGSEVAYEFVIPLASLGVSSAMLSCTSKPVQMFVVGQISTTCATGTVRGYTTPNGTGTAYSYAQYELCCSDTPVVPTSCDTAFAKGGYVFTTDAKSNPELLPSLGLSKNRWGWAINLRAAGVTTYPIYAGAGLNKISAGKLVGTLTVNYTGTQVTVTYALASGVVMTEAHLYARDNKPTTLAPGQYGNTAYFATASSLHTLTVPVSDSNGDGVWLIAHAVVCKA